MPRHYKRVRMIDIDGTVLFKDPQGMFFSGVPLSGAVEQVKKWFDAGDYIIFWTARPESYRTITAEALDKAGFVYHELRMDKPYADEIHIYDDREFVYHKVERNRGISFVDPPD